MTKSDLKVFVVVETDGHERMAVGTSLGDAFKGSMTELWLGYSRMGLIKSYPIREWVKRKAKVTNG